MITVATYTFDEALALLKQAELKLLDVQHRFASEHGYGAPGPKGEVLYRTTAQVLRRLQLVVEEYEATVRELGGKSKEVTPEASVQFHLLAQRLGL